MAGLKRALVTGGFGFFGQYIVWGLLKRNYQVVLLARPHAGGSLNHRLKSLIDSNHLVNNDFQIPNSAYEKLELIECDLANLSKAPLHYVFSQGVDEIYNCAAYMRYEEKHRAQSYAVNVRSLETLLNVALDTGCRPKVLHISTAYIGDFSKGEVLLKEAFYEGSHHINTYTDTKNQAELMLRSRSVQDQFDFQIHRLPTIIGDSVTGFTHSRFGYYEHLQAYRHLEKKYPYESAIRILAPMKGVMNLLPVDIAAEMVLQLAAKSSTARTSIFHIADPLPLPYKPLIELISQVYGIPLQLHELIPEAQLSRAEKLLARLTYQNRSFANKIIRIDSSHVQEQIEDVVSKKWVKDKSYFEKLKDGFEEFLNSYRAG